MTATPLALTVVDATSAVDVAIGEYRPFVRRTARALAKGDGALQDDLEQEAWIRLWELDPTRFQPGDQRYVARALKHRMIDCLRAHRSATNEPRMARSASSSRGSAVRRIRSSD